MQAMYGLLIYIFIVGNPDPVVQFVSPTPVYGTAGLYKAEEHCEEYAEAAKERYKSMLKEDQIILIDHTCFQANGLMQITKEQKAAIESNGSF